VDFAGSGPVPARLTKRFKNEPNKGNQGHHGEGEI
jgi:hypothetical protein